MNFWEKVKEDLQKGLEEGITVVKKGVAVVKAKAEELTEEGKKQYKIFALKAKVRDEIADLGGRVYDLSSKVKNPMLDRKVKTIVAQIKKLETQITKLEGKKVASRKAPVKRTAKSRSK